MKRAAAVLLLLASAALAQTTPTLKLKVGGVPTQSTVNLNTGFSAVTSGGLTTVSTLACTLCALTTGFTMSGDITLNNSATALTTGNYTLALKGGITMTGTAIANRVNTVNAGGQGDSVFTIASGGTDLFNYGLHANTHGLGGVRGTFGTGGYGLFDAADSGIYADNSGQLQFWAGGNRYMFLNGGNLYTNTQGGGDLGIDGSAWRRLRLHGTVPTSTSFVFTGWGTTCASTPASCLSAISGDDSHLRFTVTSTGTGQTAGPTIAYTFKDGTWTTAPICQSQLETTSTLGDQFTFRTTDSETATVLTITMNDTTGAVAPTAARTYKFNVICTGN